MVKTVNGIIVLDGCNDPNCGNNNHRNENENVSSTPLVFNPIEEPKDEPIEELATSPFVYNDDSDNVSISSSSSLFSSSDKENIPPFREPDYQFAQKIIDHYQYFMMESVKDCFQNLINLMKGYQFAYVYYDNLTFYYSAEELLSLDNTTLNQHFRIRDQLRYITEIQFKNKLLMCLRILKEMLEEEKEDCFNQNNRINPNTIQVELSLGTEENTSLFIKKIRNLLRNGKHLKYLSMTWYERVACLFDDLNRLNHESHIHFLIKPYTRSDFEEYTQFKRYTLLSDEEYERYLRENSPEY